MNDDRDVDPRIHLNELGQMAAGVGHHVINAFSASVSNAESLRLAGDEVGRGHDPAAVADTIIRTALDASGVARRLIDYSRKATAPGSALVRLDEIAAEEVKHQRSCYDTIEWVCETTPVPPIRGRAWMLRAMLGHLLDNAREALPAAGGVISVSTGCDQRGWVVLEIADNGRGMSPEDQQRAVEPFFTTKAGHVGVGLSIANGIWRRHHGTLSVRAEPGEGTRARLCIEPERLH